MTEAKAIKGVTESIRKYAKTYRKLEHMTTLPEEWIKRFEEAYEDIDGDDGRKARLLFPLIEELLSHQLEEVEREVIGEDEKETWESTIYDRYTGKPTKDKEVTVSGTAVAKNKLKAEQRQALSKLSEQLGGKE